MKQGRKIIVYIAASADGYRARPDGDVEWLNRRPGGVDYGIRAFYPTIDTILWGRRTYDWLPDYYRKRGETKGLFDTKLACGRAGPCPQAEASDRSRDDPGGPTKG